MAERVDLDAVQAWLAAGPSRTTAREHALRQAVLDAVAELRELRQDQENWFAYLRWRGEQDRKESERELERKRECERLIQEMEHADPSTHDRSGSG